MKKVLAIFAIAGLMTACGNEETPKVEEVKEAVENKVEEVKDSTMNKVEEVKDSVMSKVEEATK